MACDLVGCFAAFEEEEWIPYSLKSIYHLLDRIIFVEGAVQGYSDHYRSQDSTLQIVKDIDQDRKIELVQVDRFWDSLEEQKDQFTSRANPGDWLLINDADEIYDPFQLEKIKTLLPKTGFINFAPTYFEFYPDLFHIIPSSTPNYPPLAQRLFRFSSGMHFTCHHPTVCDAVHVDTFCQEPYLSKRIILSDFNVWHMGSIRNSFRMLNKHRFYQEHIFKQGKENAALTATDYVESLATISVVPYYGHYPAVLCHHIGLDGIKPNVIESDLC